MTERSGYFAVHSQGLGHASRSVALARGVLERRPDLYFLFLAGSPALDLVVASGFDALTMPPAPDFPSANGVLDPVSCWYREYARYLRVAGRFMRKEGDWDYYRFLISDSELASVREAVRHGVPTTLIVNEFARDFARDPVSRGWEALGNFWFSRLARRIDLILVADRGPDWPNVRRIGPIVRPPSASREQLREDLVFRKKTILVTAGGTAIGEFLLKTAMEAFRDLRLEDTSMVVVSGPKMKVDPAPGVYTYGFVPNLQDFVFAADLVITLAGKGTVHEALTSGTPVIAIPPKGHAEAERNAAALGYHFEDVSRLRTLIPEKLALGRLPPHPSGNEDAVRLLAEFLDRDSTKG
ncbi:MAG TPA: glycosyltransferase [Thermoplasmata archaeon]|nr:glycosyltransferase [Thermoplasmata archaeon]